MMAFCMFSLYIHIMCRVYTVQGRRIVCLSQIIFLRPAEVKALLTKGRQVVCPAMPGDPPECNRHSWRVDESDDQDSKGPKKAEITLLHVKWWMRFVVIHSP